MQVFTFNPHLIHLFVTTFLTLFLKVFNLQGKDASKSAGNWFQFMMVPFTNEYLPRETTDNAIQFTPVHIKEFYRVRKTEVKIRLPGKAVQNTGIRR
jgi:hypothetical protein